MDIKKLKDEHKALLKIAGNIKAQLNTNLRDQTRAKEISSTLVDLTSILGLHLAAEDRILYPKMKAAGGQAQKVATDFEKEMGGIAKTLEEYKIKWMAAKRIQQDPSKFVADTEKLLAALASRVLRENEILYPLAEQMA